MDELTVEIDKSFQNLKKIRSTIYKQLSDIDQICMNSDQLTKDIRNQYISQKTRVLQNQHIDDGNMLSSSPFNTKTGVSSSSTKAVPKIICFPAKKQRTAPQKRSTLVESTELPKDFTVPDLFVL
jgi:hypothetical protein